VARLCGSKDPRFPFVNCGRHMGHEGPHICKLPPAKDAFVIWGAGAQDAIQVVEESRSMSRLVIIPKGH
jgi:hypothetical protein